jgi:hypothetical protein
VAAEDVMAKRKHKPSPRADVRFEERGGVLGPKGSAEERERARGQTGDEAHSVHSLQGIVERVAKKRQAVDDVKGVF